MKPTIIRSVGFRKFQYGLKACTRYNAVRTRADLAFTKRLERRPAFAGLPKRSQRDAQPGRISSAGVQMLRVARGQSPQGTYRTVVASLTQQASTASSPRENAVLKPTEVLTEPQKIHSSQLV